MKIIKGNLSSPSKFLVEVPRTGVWATLLLFFVISLFVSIGTFWYSLDTLLCRTLFQQQQIKGLIRGYNENNQELEAKTKSSDLRSSQQEAVNKESWRHNITILTDQLHHLQHEFNEALAQQRYEMKAQIQAAVSKVAKQQEEQQSSLRGSKQSDNEDAQQEQEQTSKLSNSQEARFHPCQNKDFKLPQHEIAIISFVTDTRSNADDKRGDYTYGAAALLKSIQKYVPKNILVDTILLELQGPHAILSDDRVYLQQLGWNMCTVQPIPAKTNQFPHFADQFNKLHLWNFETHGTVFFLDSDTLVVGPLDETLLRKTLPPGKRIGAVRDYFGNTLAHTFNMGFCMVHPNRTEFHRLLTLQQTNGIGYDMSQAEQGFLNAVYNNQQQKQQGSNSDDNNEWEEMNLRYNANMAIWAQNLKLWPSEPKILHFTLQKPWKIRGPPSRVWSREPLENFLNIWVKAATEYKVWDDPKDENARRNGNGPQQQKEQMKLPGNEIDDERTTNYGVCLNKDFSSNKKKAIFTLLVPKEEIYTTAVRVLGASIRIQTNATDTVVLELSSHPLSDNMWRDLQAAGWSHKCTISPIYPPQQGDDLNQLSKLHIWGMVNYDTAIYLDPDTFVMGNIDQLVDMTAIGGIGDNYKIGASGDYHITDQNAANSWASTFNNGVLVIHPSWDEYQRLLQLQQDGITLYNDETTAEQGWLNVVYKDKWKEIGLMYNANVAARFDKKFTSKQNDLRIIHYTTLKPWLSETDPLCQPWAQLRDKIVAKQIDYTGN